MLSAEGYPAVVLLMLSPINEDTPILLLPDAAYGKSERRWMQSWATLSRKLEKLVKQADLLHSWGEVSYTNDCTFLLLLLF